MLVWEQSGGSIVAPQAEHLEAALFELGFPADWRLVMLILTLRPEAVCKSGIVGLRTIAQSNWWLDRLYEIGATLGSCFWRIIPCVHVCSAASDEVMKHLFDSEKEERTWIDAELLNHALAARAPLPTKFATVEDFRRAVGAAETWLMSSANRFPVPPVQFPQGWRYIENGVDAVTWHQTQHQGPARDFFVWHQNELISGDGVFGWDANNTPFTLHLYHDQSE